MTTPWTTLTSHPEMNCSSGTWQTAHLSVGSNGCQAAFGFEYAQSFNDWNATNQYNFSFSIPWIAEVNSAGALVRMASPMAPITDHTAVTRGANEVNITVEETLNVTRASGNWTPENSWAGGGTQWIVGNITIGTATIAIVFHLSNISSDSSANATRNASYSIKFDVAVASWPWQSSRDVLGLGIDSLGAGGSHFEFNQSSRTLSEVWNATGRTYASLVLGELATASYPAASPANLSVREQTALFYAASPDRRSITLLTFGGASGNYSSMTYDPWVVFVPGAIGWVPTGGPHSVWTLPFGILAAVLLVAIVSSALGSVTIHRRRLRRQGEDLFEGMRDAIYTGVDAPEHPE